MSSLTFLLGNHRSGTTWLYSLLAQAGHFSTLNAHHVIGWDTPLSRDALAASLLEQGITHRKLDGIPLTPDTPEEYCYILNNSGHKSWLTPKGRPVLDRIIDRLVVDGEGRPVVLKNPWDYAHFPALAAAYPQARFIFLHRHPLRVIQSAARVFRTMWSEQDPYVMMLSARYRRLWANPIARLVLRWAAQGRFSVDIHAITNGVRAANAHYLKHIGALPAERRVILRYEDLCADPSGALGQILSFLDAPVTPAQIPARATDSPLMPEMLRYNKVISRSMQPYLDALAYDPEGNALPWSAP